MSTGKSNTPQRAKRCWGDWPKDELTREICTRMHYLYGRTDGGMKFPNSAEGDVLKMVHVLLSNAELSFKKGAKRNEL